MPATPAFFYFDLGNVLIHFSHRRAAEQMAAASGSDFQRVWTVVFEGPLQSDLECGRISSAEFCRRFREATQSDVSDARLVHAASDIFWLNPSLAPIVGQMASAGYRLGILSNTCQAHWDHVWSRFGMLRYFFSTYMLSFEHGVMKPDAAFFEAAVKNVGCKPEDIFFVDDRPEHVAGAIACGLDAIVYTSATELGQELWRRGVHLNV